MLTRASRIMESDVIKRTVQRAFRLIITFSLFLPSFLPLACSSSSSRIYDPPINVPLSTCTTCPVTTPPSAPALPKNTYVPAISAGCAARPFKGNPNPQSFISSGVREAAWRTLTTGPGATALTRGASYVARERVKERIAPFVECNEVERWRSRGRSARLRVRGGKLSYRRG